MSSPRSGTLPPLGHRHRRARRCALRAAIAVLTLAGGALGGAALASGGVGPDRLARLDVRAMISTARPDGLWRALVVDDGGIPALFIEQVRDAGLAAASGLPAQQRRIDGFAYGPGYLTFAGQAEAIDGLAFGRHALRFDVVTSAERLVCEVPLRGARAFRARCAADLDAVARAEPPSWASRPAVIAACEATFFTAANETACLDTVARFRYAPAGIIAACDEHTFGDANALACLDAASAAVADPTRTLAACDAAMYGDSNAIRCLELALRARWDPAPTIAACDTAMYGDEHALRCVETAVRAPIAMAATVAACDRATYGDDEALACVGRGASL